MKLCKIEGCPNTSRSKGLCGKHYMQIKRYGKILERTIHDRNNFILEDDICKIELYNLKHEVVAYALIDIEDYSLIKDIKWSKLKTGYVRGKIKGKGVTLHRLVTNAPDNIFIDHKNLNKLDCRKDNLRFCNIFENNRHVGLSKNNTSGYKGVFWHKAMHKWCSKIGANNKEYTLGYFNNVIEAAKAYNKAAKRYHGEFAKLNKI